MNFVNHTPLSAELLRTTIDKDRILASVLVRATFTFAKGRSELADEQVWKICKEPTPTEHGMMEMDQVLRKGGVDLFLFGTVMAPGRARTTTMRVGLDVGNFRRQAIVVGDRVWRKEGRKLVPTPPVPFTSMPLVLERAFGGKTSWDGLELQHPDNAKGLGYYNTEDEAAGRPLPNIEEADTPIQSWSDRPSPAGFGFCPMQSYLRLSEGLKLDKEGNPIELTARLFNAAFPKMVAPAVEPADPVKITGMAGQPIELALPALPLMLRLRFGAESFEQKPLIEQVGIEVDQQRMFITYRFPFRYRTIAGQQRTCELALAEGDPACSTPS
jgi:hypothetical protein